MIGRERGSLVPLGVGSSSIGENAEEENSGRYLSILWHAINIFINHSILSSFSDDMMTNDVSRRVFLQ
jgi:hypothetical protein